MGESNGSGTPNRLETGVLGVLGGKVGGEDAGDFGPAFSQFGDLLEQSVAFRAILRDMALQYAHVSYDLLAFISRGLQSQRESRRD